MPDPHNGIAPSICSGEDQVEEFFFVAFQIPAQCIATQVSHLNHACQLAVDKQRRFDDVLNIDPKCASMKELLHQLCVLLGDRLVVIMDQKPKVRLCVALSSGLEKSLKARDDLLKRLFVYRLAHTGWIEVQLVHAFPEEPGNSPAR